MGLLARRLGAGDLARARQARVLVDGDAVGISHPRTDLADRLRAPAFALEIGFLAAGAGISTWLAFRAAAPDRRSAGGGFWLAVSLVVAAVAALLSEPGGPPPISGGFAAVGAGCLEWLWRPSRGVMLVVALRRGAPVTPAMVVRSPARPPSCSRTLRCGSSVRSTPPCTCSPGTCFRPGLPPSSRERSAPPGSAVGLSAPGCHEVSVPGRAHRRRPRPGRVDETPDGPPANLLPTRRSPRADRRTDSSPWDLLTTLGRVGTSG